MDKPETFASLPEISSDLQRGPQLETMQVYHAKAMFHIYNLQCSHGGPQNL